MTYRGRATKETAEGESAGGETFVATLGFPVLDEFGLSLRLLLRILARDILPLVRLKNGPYILRVVDTNGCPKCAQSVLELIPQMIVNGCEALTLQKRNHLDQTLSFWSSDLSFPGVHDNCVLRMRSNMVRVRIENNDLRKVAVKV